MGQNSFSEFGPAIKVELKCNNYAGAWLGCILGAAQKIVSVPAPGECQGSRSSPHLTERGVHVGIPARDSMLVAVSTVSATGSMLTPKEAIPCGGLL